MASVRVLLVVGLCAFLQCSDGLPLASNSRNRVKKAAGRQHLARKVREAGLIGKTYDFSFCSQDIQLSLGRKRVNRRSFRLTVPEAMDVVQHLHGETFEQRVEVWCKTALLSALLSHSINQRWTYFQVKELDYWQGDVIISHAQAPNMLGIEEGADAPTLTPTRRNKREALKKWKAAAKEVVKDRKKRKIIFGGIFEWANQVIPWRFDPQAQFSQHDLADIKAAMNHWEENTCFDFVENNNPFVDHIRFIKGSGCYSFIGRQTRGRRGQEVSIGNGCTLLGIAAHEIGHAIGFYHEQGRPDRDEYVDIKINNIGPQFVGNFVKQKWRNSDTAGVPYDYASIMHYAPTDFSRNPDVRQTTIAAREPYLEKTMGQREELSFFDIQAANYKFCSRQCGQRTLEWDRCQHGGYRNPRKCDECKCPKGFSPPFCEDVAKYGNVNCGQQVRQATRNYQTIQTPGYGSSGHPTSSGCAWYIQAPPGHVIELSFSGNFGMQLPNPIDLPCEDGYVEIRYQGVVKNGPRFCVNRPDEIFTSEGGEMLVRTRVGSTRIDGFQANFRAVEMQCGGCGSNPAIQESPCVRSLLSDCSLNSPSRVNRCFFSLPECCTGYTLIGEVCRRDSILGVQTSPTTTTTTTTTTTPRPVRIIPTTTTPRPTTTTTTTTTTTPLPTTTTTTTTTTPRPTTTTTTTTPRPTTTTTTTTTPRPTTTTTTTTPEPTTTTTPEPTTTTTTTTTPEPTTTTTTTTTPEPTTTTTTTTTPEPTTTTTTTTTPEPTTTTTTAREPTTTTTTTTPEPTTTTTTTTTPEPTTTTTTTTPEPTTTTTTTTTTPEPTTTTTTTTTTNAPEIGNVELTTTIRPPPSSKGWGEWGAWGQCSSNCGLCGRSMRIRRCNTQPCSGHSVQVRSCPDIPCPNVPRTRVCIDTNSRCGWWSVGPVRNGVCVKTKICVDEGSPCCKGAMDGGSCVVNRSKREAWHNAWLEQ